ncbi:class I SAM-dependent methyltransferase [Vreelandella rituensis]|uniref:Class I SAM-dependent methyltransferase n=1 Tax=Vreelandella rituensis TaxID=2282306 RepID=A0A368UA68_9GAMM|nr:class I SAM-dependent methyltransferase [Halomonas rituensis]RCV93884.1 class I SAM-dependent methyltransferase [Halomonas rituensis]
MPTQDTTKRLGQYMTPAWAAEALVRAHLRHLDSDDFVVEPSCGIGRFLQAIPGHVPVTGIEIDPVLAQQPREITGREVICGDFRTIDLPHQPTAIVGNPPFSTSTIEQFLDRSHDLLTKDGRVAFVLPAYFFQNARRTVRYSEQWSLTQEMLPRNLFQGLQYPLVFATFTKDKKRLMVGFALYDELAYLQELPKETQDAMREGPATWGELVGEALARMGGEATLREIYNYVADRRPTANPAWREQVRKVCQQKAKRIGRGRYASQSPANTVRTGAA